MPRKTYNLFDHPELQKIIQQDEQYNHAKFKEETDKLEPILMDHTIKDKSLRFHVSKFHGKTPTIKFGWLFKTEDKKWLYALDGFVNCIYVIDLLNYSFHLNTFGRFDNDIDKIKNDLKQEKVDIKYQLSVFDENKIYYIGKSVWSYLLGMSRLKYYKWIHYDKFQNSVVEDYIEFTGYFSRRVISENSKTKRCSIYNQSCMRLGQLWPYLTPRSSETLDMIKCVEISQEEFGELWQRNQRKPIKV